MTTQSSNSNYFNEASHERQLKLQAKKARLVLAIAFGFVFLLMVIAMVVILAMGAELPPTTYIFFLVTVPAVYGLYKRPDRKLMRRGWPKPAIECHSCHAHGWPEDLTPALTCPRCGHKKFGRPNTKPARRNATHSASSPEGSGRI